MLSRTKRIEKESLDPGKARKRYLISRCNTLQPWGGGVLPYMGNIVMCRWEGYGFQAVYSSIGRITYSVWVWNRLSFFTKLTSWLKILSRLRKPGIATQKYKQMKSASLNFHDSASTAFIHDYHKALLDIINC